MIQRQCSLFKKYLHEYYNQSGVASTKGGLGWVSGRHMDDMYWGVWKATRRGVSGWLIDTVGDEVDSLGDVRDNVCVELEQTRRSPRTVEVRWVNYIAVMMSLNKTNDRVKTLVDVHLGARGQRLKSEVMSRFRFHAPGDNSGGLRVTNIVTELIAICDCRSPMTGVSRSEVINIFAIEKQRVAILCFFDHCGKIAGYSCAIDTRNDVNKRAHWFNHSHTAESGGCLSDISGISGSW